MKMGPRRKVKFRRKREGRTDYYYRTRLLRSGKSRVVVRPTLKHISVQFINPGEKGDVTIASAHSKDLSKFGWKASFGNVPAAYLTGLLCGFRAKSAGVSEGIMDVGKFVPTPQGRVFAALKGVVDSGVTVPYGESSVPKDERTRGDHIAKSGEVTNIPEHFNQIKQAILAEHGG